MDDRTEQSGSETTLPSRLPGLAAPARGSVALPGDPSFNAFYRSFTPTLVAFLVWQGTSLADAADIAQETMVQAYRHWKTIRQPQAWARRVAARAYARQVASIEEDLVADFSHTTPLLRAETDVTVWEERHHVLRLLALLPSRQRQVMAWTFDGYTPSEIAKELNMTPEAVRSNQRQARSTLAAQISLTPG